MRRKTNLMTNLAAVLLAIGVVVGIAFMMMLIFW